jgi:hypothetical protein
MSKIIHSIMFLFIVFILAEIRTVLLHDIPYGDGPITIWTESADASGADNTASSLDRI